MPVVIWIIWYMVFWIWYMVFGLYYMVYGGFYEITYVHALNAQKRTTNMFRDI